MSTTEIVQAAPQSVATVQQDSTAAVLAVIARAASDPSVDVAKMQALMEMHQKLTAQKAEIEFNENMRAVQAEIMPVVRDAENSHTKSMYARLETIDEAIRPVYTKYGFSLTFDSEPADREGELRIRCEVLHSAGHFKKYQLQAPLDVAGAQGKANKTGVQGVGSTTAYLRRYLTCMIFNIVLANEDRDGNTQRGYLSQQQISNIYNLISACELDQQAIGRFLEYMAADSVEHIYASDYSRAELQLKRKLSTIQNGTAKR